MSGARLDVSIPFGIPRSEVSPEFVQGMIDRTAASFHKYGPAADAFDVLDALMTRLREYRRTGNVECLIDVANFAMVEYMRSAPDAT